MLLRISNRASRSLVLVPAEVVRSVIVLPSITPVEGLRAPAAGVALASGEVITVLCLDDDGLGPSAQNERTYAVLCDVDGRPVAIAARSIEGSGLFEEVHPGAVHTDDGLAEIVDVTAIYHQAEEAIRAERGSTLLPEEDTSR